MCPYFYDCIRDFIKFWLFFCCTNSSPINRLIDQFLSYEFCCRKKKGKGDKNRPISNEAGAASEDQQPVKEQLSESERLLMQR